MVVITVMVASCSCEGELLGNNDGDNTSRSRWGR
jgi:hypothetical protein